MRGAGGGACGVAVRWATGSGIGGGGCGLDGSSRGGSSSGLADWEYVAPQGSRGARLWQRMRARCDQLARLQGLTRGPFLVLVVLTLAANAATGSERESVLSAIEGSTQREMRHSE